MLGNNTTPEVVLLPPRQPASGLSSASTNGDAAARVTHVQPWQAAAVPASEPVEQALLRALRRRWRSILGLGLLAAILGATATWYILPPKYTTRALLHFSARPAHGLFTAPENQESTEDLYAHQRTQAALLKSREVIQAALRHPKVAERREIQEHPYPVVWLAENLRIDSNVGPEILSVSLSGDHPEDLPILVNAVVQAYLQELANKERLKQPARLEQLDGNYRRLSDTLRRKRALLRDLETNLGVDSPQMLLLRYQSALQQLTATEKEAVQSKIALKSAQLELALLKSEKSVSTQDAPLAVNQQLAQDATYQMLLARKAMLLEENSHLRGIAAAGVRDSVTHQSQTQLAALDRELAARREVLLPAIAAQERAKLEVRVAVLQEQQKELADEFQRQEREVKRLADAIRQPDKPTGELESLRDEVTLTEQVLKKVGEQRDLLKMEPSLPLRVSLLEAADVPQIMDVKQHGKMAGLTGLGLFGLIVCGICWREYGSHRIETEEDVVRYVGMNLLATLPAFPPPSRVGSNSDPDTQALLRISVDSLRANLLRVSKEQSLRIFVITSATANEGKTSLATELAASLAFAGCKTLLIDGDIHHPQTHHRFSLPVEPGFSDLLLGDATMQEVVQPTPDQASLWVMPAGKKSGNAILALAQAKSQVLFDDLREHYDIVLIQAAPVLERVDAAILGKYADAAILSAYRDVSQLASLQEAYQRLTNAGTRVLGAVVAGMVGRPTRRGTYRCQPV